MLRQREPRGTMSEMENRRHFIEPLICCVGASGSLLAFTELNPFQMRDGFFLGALVDAYPYFLLTPILSAASVYFGRFRPGFQCWGIAVLILFLLLPETHRFARCWLAHLNPMDRFR